MDWLSYSLITLVLMGLLNVILKVAAVRNDAFSVTSFTALAAVITLIPLLISRRKIEFSSLGVIAGVLWAVGIVFLNMALAKGEVSRVVPITALGGVLSAIIGIIVLKESLTVAKIIGIVLAAIAIVLLSL